MSQSNYIAAAIAVAFLVFITAKGSLSKYVTLLTGGAGFGQDTAAAGTKTTAEQAADASGSTGNNVPADTGAKGETSDSSGSGSSATQPLDILGSVIKGTVGGQADEILGGVAGKLGVGAIIGGLL